MGCYASRLADVRVADVSKETTTTKPHEAFSQNSVLTPDSIRNESRSSAESRRQEGSRQSNRSLHIETKPVLVQQAGSEVVVSNTDLHMNHEQLQQHQQKHQQQHHLTQSLLPNLYPQTSPKADEVAMFTAHSTDQSNHDGSDGSHHTSPLHASHSTSTLTSIPTHHNPSLDQLDLDSIIGQVIDPSDVAAALRLQAALRGQIARKTNKSAYSGPKRRSRPSSRDVKGTVLSPKNSLKLIPSSPQLQTLQRHGTDITSITDISAGGSEMDSAHSVVSVPK